MILSILITLMRLTATIMVMKATDLLATPGPWRSRSPYPASRKRTPSDIPNRSPFHGLFGVNSGSSWVEIAFFAFRDRCPERMSGDALGTGCAASCVYSSRRERMNLLVTVLAILERHMRQQCVIEFRMRIGRGTTAFPVRMPLLTLLTLHF